MVLQAMRRGFVISAFFREIIEPFLGKLREKSYKKHSRSTMIQFPGYNVTEEIYAGTKTLVDRGIRQGDKQSVHVTNVETVLYGLYRNV